MGSWIGTLWQDLRFGARTLRKNPGFALAAIFTLALGIAANTAIFTVTNAVLLRALPYADPGKLVHIDLQRKEGGSNGFSLNRYDLLRHHTKTLAGVAVCTSDSMNLTGGGEPQQVPVGRVSPNFFDLLGVRAARGRTFLSEEGQPEGKPVVMISDSLWHTRFGADRGIVGQTLNLDSAPYTIIGVLPADVQYPFMGPAEVWTPRYFELTVIPAARLRLGVGYLTAIGRLSSNASLKTAPAEMEVLDRQYTQENPKAPDAGGSVSMVVGNLQERTVAGFRIWLLVLSIAVGLVLLIACANVASLLLSRALARRREIAVRAALGARRSAVLRQLLTESLLLALVAGAVGLAMGFAATRLLAAWGAENLPRGIPIAMDNGVFLFTLAVSLATGLIFGIFPALQLSRTDVNSALRDEGRGATGGRGRTLLRAMLVVSQVALSLPLLISAGLLVRSFGHLLKVNPGFDPHNVLVMNVSLPTVKYSDPQKQIAFFDELLRRVSALPGVRSAGISAALPLTPKRITPVLPEGQPEVALAERPFTIVEATSPKFLETLRIPINAGRAFTEADNFQAPKVIIVNEALARRYWPGQNPVGKHILIGRQTVPSEIVGLAANVKNNGLAVDPQPQIYLPFPQIPWNNMNLLVSSVTDPRPLVPAVRAQVAALDSDQPVTGIETVEELMDSSRLQPRSMLLLFGAFSATALALVVVGIYGVLAYSVAQRRGELGIRLALGAEKQDILRMVVKQGLTLTTVGIGIGLALALILSFVLNRFVSDQLYKVGTHDLLTFVLAPLAFMAIALLASYLPALRATRVDPTETLRGS